MLLHPSASVRLSLLVCTLQGFAVSTAHAESREKTRSRIRPREVGKIAAVQKDTARAYYEKTYNRENLERQFSKPPAKAPTLGDDARKFFGGAASRVTNANSESRNHSKVLKLYEQAPVPTVEKQQLRAAAGKLDD